MSAHSDVHSGRRATQPQLSAQAGLEDEYDQDGCVQTGWNSWRCRTSCHLRALCGIRGLPPLAPRQKKREVAN